MVQTTKEYKDDAVIVHISINGKQPYQLAFDDEQEVRQLGDCLKTLAAGSRSVKIG